MHDALFCIKLINSTLPFKLRRERISSELGNVAGIERGELGLGSILLSAHKTMIIWNVNENEQQIVQ